MAEDIKKFETVPIADIGSIGNIAKADVASVNGVDNTGSGSIIVFQDDFTGSSLNTSVWEVTNSNPTYNIQTWTGDELKMYQKQTGSFKPHSFRTKSTVVPKASFSISFDWKITCGANTFQPSNIYSVPNASGTGSESFLFHHLFGSGSSGIIGGARLTARDADNILLKDLEVTVGWVKGIYTTFKIAFDGTTLYWQYWNGSSWTTISSVATTMLAADCDILINYYTGGDSSTETYIKNLYVCSEDFSTQYPT